MIVRELLLPDGTSPFRRWLETLDLSVRARIQARVLRFELGNVGDHQAVGDGVSEARLDFGAGYRIYFGRLGPSVVILIVGGDKRSQSTDIRFAKRAWSEFLKAARHGKTN